jgi:sugar phosphate isomerase/epimerase
MNGDKFNPPMGLMSSIAPKKSAAEVVDMTADLGMQVVELVSIQGPRQDHVAFHIDPKTFGYAEAQGLIDHCNNRGVRIATVGCYSNPMFGGPDNQTAELDHMLAIGRVVGMLNGEKGENGVDFGYFPGWDPELGGQRYGFQKNLHKWEALQLPVMRHNQDLGVWSDTENCPGEGLGVSMEQYVNAFNNLAAVPAARKLMYRIGAENGVTMLGETHDPSHKWDGGDPAIEVQDMGPERTRRVHLKTYRLKKGDSPHVRNWGRLLPMQALTERLAEIAKEEGIPLPSQGWDRCHYGCEHPGFNGNDDVNWPEYIGALKKSGFKGPLINELEAGIAKWNGNEASIKQALTAAGLYVASLAYPLSDGGYIFDRSDYRPMAGAAKPGKIVTIGQLVGDSTLQKWLG